MPTQGPGGIGLGLVQTPVNVSGNRVYSSDIWVEQSNIGDFNGNVTDLFNNLHSVITNTTSDNPKELLIHFNSTIPSLVIGVGAFSGNFSNLKVIGVTSGNVEYTLYDGSSDNTKKTTATIYTPTVGYNALKLQFHTSDPVSISNIFILKAISGIMRIQGIRPDGSFVEFAATQGGSFKSSFEEYEPEFFNSNPLPVLPYIGSTQISYINPVPTKDFRIVDAIEVIEDTYGDVVSIIEKKKNLIKWGRNQFVGTTPATIMTLPTGLTNESFVSDNLITHFASGDNSDTQSITFEGHTIDGSGNKTFVVQTNTLEGQTKKALLTPLARITRAYNNDSAEWNGPIYVAQDVTFTAGVPQTDTAIHLTVPAGEQQSEKASTSVSSVDYWIVSSFHLSCLKKQAAYVSGRIEVRLNGKVFRPTGPYVAAGAGQTTAYNFDPYLIIPKNSDMRLRAIADSAGTDVSGGVQGYLATIIV